jgi:hypothetical protein
MLRALALLKPYLQVVRVSWGDTSERALPLHTDEFFVTEIRSSKVARDGLLAESLPA